MAMADAAAWLLLSSVRVLPAACTGGSAPRGASRVARVLSLLSVDCSECSTNYSPPALRLAHAHAARGGTELR